MQHLAGFGIARGDPRPPGADACVVIQRVGNVVGVEAHQHQVGLETRHVAFEQRHLLARVVAAHAEIHHVQIATRKSFVEQLLELGGERLVVSDAPAQT